LLLPVPFFFIFSVSKDRLLTFLKIKVIFLKILGMFLDRINKKGERLDQVDFFGADFILRG
jgi:hypothetical protein